MDFYLARQSPSGGGLGDATVPQRGFGGECPQGSDLADIKARQLLSSQLDHSACSFTIARSTACKAKSTSASLTINGGTHRTTFGPAGTNNSPSAIAAFTISPAVNATSGFNTQPLIKPQP